MDGHSLGLVGWFCWETYLVRIKKKTGLICLFAWSTGTDQIDRCEMGRLELIHVCTRRVEFRTRLDRKSDFFLSTWR